MTIVAIGLGVLILWLARPPEWVGWFVAFPVGWAGFASAQRLLLSRARNRHGTSESGPEMFYSPLTVAILWGSAVATLVTVLLTDPSSWKWPAFLALGQGLWWFGFWRSSREKKRFRQAAGLVD